MLRQISAAKNLISKNPTGAVIGALEGIISAKLPGMMEDKKTQLLRAKIKSLQEETGYLNYKRGFGYAGRGSRLWNPGALGAERVIGNYGLEIGFPAFNRANEYRFNEDGANEYSGLSFRSSSDSYHHGLPSAGDIAMISGNNFGNNNGPINWREAMCHRADYENLNEDDDILYRPARNDYTGLGFRPNLARSLTMASNQNQDLPSASSSNNSATGRIAMNVLGTLLGAPGEASADTGSAGSGDKKPEIPNKYIALLQKQIIASVEEDIARGRLYMEQGEQILNRSRELRSTWRELRHKNLQELKGIYGNDISDIGAYIQKQQAKWMLEHVSSSGARKDFSLVGVTDKSSAGIIIGAESKQKTDSFELLRFGNKDINIGATGFIKKEMEINPIELSTSDGLNSSAGVNIHTGVNVAQLKTSVLNADINVASCHGRVGADKLLSGVNPSVSGQCSAAEANIELPKQEIVCGTDKCLVGQANVSVKYGTVGVKFDENQISEIDMKAGLSIDGGYNFSLQDKPKPKKG